MTDKYIEKTKEIILKNIDKKSTAVFLFGSRANNKKGKSADVDIGFLSSGNVNSSVFQKIYTELEESIVPYHIDLVDFSKVDNDFKKTAMKKIEIWNKGKYFS